MTSQRDKLLVILQKGGERTYSRIPLRGVNRVVVVYNRQYTNSPNTTQIASGAGESSAAGNNAAISSPYTFQQQSVGAEGTANNIGKLSFAKNHKKPVKKKSQSKRYKKEVVIVINDQIAELPEGTEASATQVASGGGKDSTAGTNAAIDSEGTKQQHAVGGGGTGYSSNKLLKQSKTTRRKKRCLKKKQLLCYSRRKRCKR